MSRNLTDGNSFGEKISLDEANDLVKEYVALDKVTKRVVDAPEGSLLKVKAEEMSSKSYNAFIFTKDLIMRFFDGSESDEFGNPKSSNFLMVVLGAHPTKKGDFEAGSFTVLTAGCERIIEKDAKGNPTVKFYPLNILQPANEYPPHYVMPVLKEEKDGKDKIDYFVASI